MQILLWYLILLRILFLMSWISLLMTTVSFGIPPFTQYSLRISVNIPGSILTQTLNCSDYFTSSERSLVRFAMNTATEFPRFHNILRTVLHQWSNLNRYSTGSHLASEYPSNCSIHRHNTCSLCTQIHCFPFGHNMVL